MNNVARSKHLVPIFNFETISCTRPSQQRHRRPDGKYLTTDSKVSLACLAMFAKNGVSSTYLPNCTDDLLESLGPRCLINGWLTTLTIPLHPFYDSKVIAHYTQLNFRGSVDRVIRHEKSWRFPTSMCKILGNVVSLRAFL